MRRLLHFRGTPRAQTELEKGAEGSQRVLDSQARPGVLGQKNAAGAQGLRDDPGLPERPGTDQAGQDKEESRARLRCKEARDSPD